jgi:hypothetical protein
MAKSFGAEALGADGFAVRGPASAAPAVGCALVELGSNQLGWTSAPVALNSDLSLKANRSGDTFTGDVAINRLWTSNPIGATHAFTISRQVSGAAAFTDNTPLMKMEHIANVAYPYAGFVINHNTTVPGANPGGSYLSLGGPTNSFGLQFDYLANVGTPNYQGDVRYMLTGAQSKHIFQVNTGATPTEVGRFDANGLTVSEFVRFGSTAAFPMWKRNGTTLDAKLADDSAHTSVQLLNVILASGSSVIDWGDVRIALNSATLMDVRANGGLRVRNFANNADAPLTAASGTFSGGVTLGGNIVSSAPGGLRVRNFANNADAPLAAASGTFSGGVTLGGNLVSSALNNTLQIFSNGNAPNNIFVAGGSGAGFRGAYNASLNSSQNAVRIEGASIFVAPSGGTLGNSTNPWSTVTLSAGFSLVGPGYLENNINCTGGFTFNRNGTPVFRTGLSGTQIHAPNDNNGINFLSEGGSTPTVWILPSGRIGINETPAFGNDCGLFVRPRATSVPSIIAQAIGSQTADLQQWRNSSGTTLASVDASGYVATRRLRVATSTPSQPIGFFNYGDIQLITPSGSPACFSITQDIIGTGHFGFAASSNSFVLGSDGAAISFRQNPTATLAGGTERLRLTLSNGDLLTEGKITSQRSATPADYTRFEWGRIETTGAGLDLMAVNNVRCINASFVPIPFFVGDITQGTSDARWTIPAAGQRSSQVGNGAGVWQTGYREEYNAGGVRAGFFGATPVAQQSIAAAATDPATTQTLANSLRTAMRNLGLGV